MYVVHCINDVHLSRDNEGREKYNRHDELHAAKSFLKTSWLSISQELHQFLWNQIYIRVNKSPPLVYIQNQLNVPVRRRPRRKVADLQKYNFSEIVSAYG